MQDAVAAGHALPHQIDARDLAFEELTTEFAQCGRLRGHADEREDLITPFAQLADDPSADESRRPGDECAHSRHCIRNLRP